MCQWCHPHDGTVRRPMSRWGVWPGRRRNKRGRVRDRRRRRLRPVRCARLPIPRLRTVRYIEFIHDNTTVPRWETLPRSTRRRTLRLSLASPLSLVPCTTARTYRYTGGRRTRGIVARKRSCAPRTCLSPCVARARVRVCFSSLDAASPVQSVVHQSAVRARVYGTHGNHRHPTELRLTSPVNQPAGRGARRCRGNTGLFCSFLKRYGVRETHTQTPRYTPTKLENESASLFR